MPLFRYCGLRKDELRSYRKPRDERGGRAGIKAAQTILNQNVDVVLTGNIGPNAFNVLAAAGVKTVTGISGTVRDVVEK